MNEPAENPVPASPPVHVARLRVRYSETDQMGTFYNSRALEWFECGRTELMRSLGTPYSQFEAQGVLLPLVEAHVQYLGRARYDDLLRITTTAAMSGRARMRFDVDIVQDATGAGVARGYTEHAITDANGRPARPPAWLLDLLPMSSSNHEPAKRSTPQRQ